MGTMRGLKATQRAKVKRIQAEKGIRAAIEARIGARSFYCSGTANHPAVSHAYRRGRSRPWLLQ